MRGPETASTAEASTSYRTETSSSTRKRTITAEQLRELSTHSSAPRFSGATVRDPWALISVDVGMQIAAVGSAVSIPLHTEGAVFSPWAGKWSGSQEMQSFLERDRQGTLQAQQHRQELKLRRQQNARRERPQPSRHWRQRGGAPLATASPEHSNGSNHRCAHSGRKQSKMLQWSLVSVKWWSV